MTKCDEQQNLALCIIISFLVIWKPKPFEVQTSVLLLRPAGAGTRQERYAKQSRAVRKCILRHTWLY